MNTTLSQDTEVGLIDALSTLGTTGGPKLWTLDEVKALGDGYDELTQEEFDIFTEEVNDGVRCWRGHIADDFDDCNIEED